MRKMKILVLNFLILSSMGLMFSPLLFDGGSVMNTTIVPDITTNTPTARVADALPWGKDGSVSQSNASWTGEASLNYFGFTATGVGDVNNDGYDDFAIGAYLNDQGGTYAGKVYLFLGKASGWSNGLSASTADATFIGEEADDEASYSITGLGDLNKDGYDDFLIGAFRNSEGSVSERGKAYLMYGRATQYWTTDMDLGGTFTANATFLGKAAGDSLGQYSGSLGDINDDSYPDFAIGAPKVNGPGGSDCGYAYVFFGNATSWSGNIPLEVANASYYGETADDWAGGQMRGIGDFNKDGFNDFMICAHDNDESYQYGGQVYLFLGKATGWQKDVSLGTAAASFLSGGYENFLGVMSPAIDLNDDGNYDIILGSAYNDDGGSNAGKVYIFFGNGTMTGWSLDMPVDLANATITGNAESYSGGCFGVIDINQDGKDDILVGAANNDEVATDAGEAYILLGRETQYWSKGMDLDEAANATFRGVSTSAYAGCQVSPVGDVNKDGGSDFLIGSYGYSSGTGITYLFLGKPKQRLPWEMDSNVAISNASWTGEASLNYFGFNAKGVGDVNNDGYDDFAVGAYLNDQGGTYAGKVYLFLGKASGWTNGLSASTADASFIGEVADDYAGYDIDGIGDMNKDGYDDFLIGARQNSEGGVSQRGKAYLMLGRATQFWSSNMDLGDAYTANATFLGNSASDWLSYSLGGIGDVNGDTYPDFAINALAESGTGGSNCGMVYIFFGNSSGWTGNIALSVANASFHGESMDDRAGIVIKGIGDFNGDNFDDFLVCAHFNSESINLGGQIYLILGKESGWIKDESLVNANASFLGEGEEDYLSSIAGSIDLNGDGYRDIVIGSSYNDDGGNMAGQTYIFLGNGTMTGWGMDMPVQLANSTIIGDAESTSGGTFGVIDIDQDGVDDLLVGAANSDEVTTDAGEAFIVLGQSTEFWQKGMVLDNSASASFRGGSINQYVGFQAISVGDVNDDGTPDFLIGAYGYSSGAGRTYLFLGPPGDQGFPSIGAVTGESDPISEWFDQTLNCEITDTGNPESGLNWSVVYYRTDSQAWDHSRNVTFVGNTATISSLEYRGANTVYYYIAAADNAGNIAYRNATSEGTDENLARAGAFSFTVETDDTAPSISQVTGESDPITQDADQTLDITISDMESGIEWQVVYYRNEAQAWSSDRNVTVIGTTATIPNSAYSYGDTVYYYVGAKDNAQNVAYRDSVSQGTSEATAQANAYSFDVTPDTILPTISDVTGVADPISENTNQILGVTITDLETGIDWQVVYYRTDAQGWTQDRNVTVIGTTATIPNSAYAFGDTVFFYVAAKDNAGNYAYRNATAQGTSEALAQAGAWSFTVSSSDIIPPTIGVISGLENPVEFDTAQTVDSTVSDAGGSGLDWCVLFYRVNTQPWNSIQNVSISGGTFTLPSDLYNYGDSVEFYIGARDTAGNYMYRYDDTTSQVEVAAQASPFEFTVTESVAPTIGEVSIAEDPIRDGQNQTITCAITDIGGSGLDLSRVIYKTSEQIWAPARYARFVDDVATIPSTEYTREDTVQFYIVAQDNAGNVIYRGKNGMTTDLNAVQLAPFTFQVVVDSTNGVWQEIKEGSQTINCTDAIGALYFEALIEATGSARIRITVSTDNPLSTALPGALRYFDIDLENAHKVVFPVDAKFYYDPATIQGSESDLKVYHFKDGKWQEAQCIVKEGQNYILVECDSFSVFAIVDKDVALDVPGYPSALVIACLGVGIVFLVRNKRKHRKHKK